MDELKAGYAGRSSAHSVSVRRASLGHDLRDPLCNARLSPLPEGAFRALYVWNFGFPAHFSEKAEGGALVPREVIG